MLGSVCRRRFRSAMRDFLSVKSLADHDTENAPFSRYLRLCHVFRIIEASLSEPHMTVHLCAICLYVWYVVWPSPALCRSYTIHCAWYKIFHAIQAACCNVCVLHCASVQRTLPRVQTKLWQLDSSQEQSGDFKQDERRKEGSLSRATIVLLFFFK